MNGNTSAVYPLSTMLRAVWTLFARLNMSTDPVFASLIQCIIWTSDLWVRLCMWLCIFVCTEVIRSVVEECLTPACESDVTLWLPAAMATGGIVPVCSQTVFTVIKRCKKASEPRKGEKSMSGGRESLKKQTETVWNLHVAFCSVLTFDTQIHKVEPLQL